MWRILLDALCNKCPWPQGGEEQKGETGAECHEFRVRIGQRENCFHLFQLSYAEGAPKKRIMQPFSELSKI